MEGKAVEAALSALRPEFNRAPGDGPRFVPIVVYLALGDVLPDGRRKPDPARPSDTVVIANMEGVWDPGRTSTIGDVLRKSHLGS